ncbi:MAG: hypothetical protein LBD59_04885 [Prevotellaceae bacterium]|jgi:TPR repeat protein|nr:hypothetical protein [Prevotellaceae bacterium]
MEFKYLYEKLLNEKKQIRQYLSDESFARLVKRLDNPEKWLEALAVCEAAIDAGLVNDNMLNLRREMFANARELHVSAKYDAHNYTCWFSKLVVFNKKLIDADIAEAWVELGSLYLNARYPLRDVKKAERYMLQGVRCNDPLALAYYGYLLYFGINNIPINKEKGKRLMLKSQKLGYSKATAYLLTALFDEGLEPQLYKEKIDKYTIEAKPADQLWHLLGNYYKDIEQNIDLANAAYERGIEVANDPYCTYQKAVLILTEKIEGDFDEALEMLQDAADWNITHAMTFLGQFYWFNEQYLDIEAAIYWNKKAIECYDTFALFNLAVIYLYNDEHRNVDQGMEYLDQAIEHNDPRAMNEKAHLLLEENKTWKNLRQAKILLEKACATGDEYAPFRLGLGYQNAEFVKKNDYHKAYEYFSLAAERNNLHAIELLGRYCRMGLAREPDPEKTIEYFNRAVAMDSNYARVELAMCYEDGFGVEQDCDKAFELLKTASDNKYPYADVKLGHYYMNGLVGEPDTDKAFEHFSRAADSGDADAMYCLGRIYKYAVGKPENPELALHYFTKAVENESDNAGVELALAYEYEYGGLQFDANKILEYITPPANNGHPYALYKLGYYYCYKVIGDDVEKGLDYFRQAFDKGSMQAALALGDYFLYGENANYDEAFKYYQCAGEQDFITEGLGFCFLFGLGVERNETEAFKYLSIAADRDNVSAKHRLGLCYKYGTGTEINRAEAFRYIREAAEAGYIESAYEAGMFLLNGEGVPANPAEGVKWLRSAADQNYDPAQYELGNCYLMGLGVEEDDAQAMFWYKQASENGNEDAKKITKMQ